MRAGWYSETIVPVNRVIWGLWIYEFRSAVAILPKGKLDDIASVLASSAMDSTAGCYQITIK
ncbi:hypothetical protein [Endozoicomonas sp.]|uniref:hypothetical protein n=1 Tax=Endozoicomonas sp. TaxID=1892382 RepID=UPI002885D037|nr:hypothetical protein [Endozoicomonas sp.]